jgi:hypothetical protein
MSVVRVSECDSSFPFQIFIQFTSIKFHNYNAREREGDEGEKSFTFEKLMLIKNLREKERERIRY